MENVERTILIPDDFHRLTEDEQETISNEMFQYLWGWKNKKHDKPISVNGVVYWIIQSRPPNRTSFSFCNEEQVAVWDDFLFSQQPYARPIGVAGFRRERNYQKKGDFQRIAHRICGGWIEHYIADANQRVEDWKVRRREICVEHFGVDMPYHDPYAKEVA
jgi:hypothetical protein